MARLADRKRSNSKLCAPWLLAWRLLERQLGIFTDLTGRSLAHMTVTGQSGRNKHGQITWRALCECGEERFLNSGDIKSGKVKSCGCKKSELCKNIHLVDLSGRRYGRIFVVSPAFVKDRKHYYNIRCECGTEKTVAGSHLIRGAVQSCGCLKRELLSSVRSLDLTGLRFGKLTAVSFEKVVRGGRHWRCLCDCGNSHLVSANRLHQGRCISCGCAPVGKNINPLTSLKSRAQAAADGHRRRARKLSAGGSFTAAQITELNAKQRGRCANCGCKLTPSTLRRDHRQALANGGSNDILNIEILCDPCNSRKSSKDEIAWAQENWRLL